MKRTGILLALASLVLTCVAATATSQDDALGRWRALSRKIQSGARREAETEVDRLEPTILRNWVDRIDQLEPFDRSMVALVFGRVGAQMIDELVGTVDRGVVEARRRAALALGHVLEHGRAEDLLAALERPENDRRRVRSALLIALGASRQPMVLPPLEAALEFGSTDVVASAATGLGRLADPRAVPLLCDLLAHPSALVRYSAEYALSSIGESAVSLLEIRIAITEQPTARAHMARVAATVGGETAIEVLRSLLEDAHWVVRGKVVEGILVHRRVELLAAIRERVEKEKHPFVRSVLERSLLELR